MKLWHCLSIWPFSLAPWALWAKVPSICFGDLGWPDLTQKPSVSRSRLKHRGPRFEAACMCRRLGAWVLMHHSLFGQVQIWVGNMTFIWDLLALKILGNNILDTVTFNQEPKLLPVFYDFVRRLLKFLRKNKDLYQRLGKVPSILGLELNRYLSIAFERSFTHIFLWTILFQPNSFLLFLSTLLCDINWFRQLIPMLGSHGPWSIFPLPLITDIVNYWFGKTALPNACSLKRRTEDYM